VDHEREEVEIAALEVTAEPARSYNVPIRTTYLLAAGQVVRNGIARIPYPGGCKIGSRGYDLHVRVWERLGCQVTEREDHIEIRGQFRGGIIDFPISTVGGTENALLCTSVAQGDSEIRNAYITPEIENLVELLRRMGAQIEVFGNSFIHVKGAGGLLRGARIPVMPDRIEALTWITLAVLAGGELRIDDVPFGHMEIPLTHLEKSGIDLFRNSSSVYVSPECITAGFVQPFEVACGTHPGVISDMQPFYVLLGLRAAGISQIYDYRYPGRIAYVQELAKFCPGALDAKAGQITTRGVAKLLATEAVSTDLRGSMAVIMAAIAADGTSRIEGVAMALRGYNDLLGKLAQVGVAVQPEYTD
jgi:UDP-N-acetylglucosamine 1-carboxyvinyltransferase